MDIFLDVRLYWLTKYPKYVILIGSKVFIWKGCKNYAYQRIYLRKEKRIERLLAQQSNAS